MNTDPDYQVPVIHKFDPELAILLPEDAELDLLAFLNDPVGAGGSAEAPLVALVDRGSNLYPALQNFFGGVI